MTNIYFNTINGEKRVSYLQIAEITGKHSNEVFSAVKTLKDLGIITPPEKAFGDYYITEKGSYIVVSQLADSQLPTLVAEWEAINQLSN